MFAEQPSVKLCCQLCCSVFKDPVITTCGVRSQTLFLHNPRCSPGAQTRGLLALLIVLNWLTGRCSLPARDEMG